MFRKTGLKRMFSLFAVVLMAAVATSVNAQNVASQKAYFGSADTEILGPDGDRILHGYIKTSGVGDMLIGVSLECALWTATSNTATKGGSKTSSSSRAAVNITVKINGQEAIPGQVVFCDRQQTVNLQFISDDTENITNDAILLEMFLRTKNANHFNFYGLNPGSGIHEVEVFADSIVETDGQQVVIDNTRAVVGKRTLVIEEHNNP